MIWTSTDFEVEACGDDGEVDIEPYDENEDGPEYESGPFCRHWGDPSECHIECANCGHRCAAHDHESRSRDDLDGGACNADDCTCECYIDPDQKEENAMGAPEEDIDENYSNDQKPAPAAPVEKPAEEPAKKEEA